MHQFAIAKKIFYCTSATNIGEISQILIFIAIKIILKIFRYNVVILVIFIIITIILKLIIVILLKIILAMNMNDY